MSIRNRYLQLGWEKGKQTMEGGGAEWGVYENEARGDGNGNLKGQV